MVSKRKLPAQLRNVELVYDLVVEDDDFLDHPDEVLEEELLSEEVQEMFPLFPQGEDEELARQWRELFEGDASLRAIAPLTSVAYTEAVRTAATGHYSGSGRDLGIADRLRAYGLKVVEVAGWQTRGSATFHPRGSVDHHTAGGLRGNAPSLNIVTNGRTDLPGPLCHVLIGRDNTCYVIASGRANHAGTGAYAGVTGNSNVYGVERENTGVGNEPWREDQRLTAAKCHAALLDWNRNGFVCQHKEWTSRKIDVWDQSGPDMRSRTVKAWAAFDNKEPQEMPLFKDHATRVGFVKDSYRQITGREVESQATLDYWTWLIGAEELNALRMVNGLHEEIRTKQATEIAAAKAAAGSAASKATIASSQATTAIEQGKGLAVRVTELENAVVAPAPGTGGVTIAQVLAELSSRLTP